MLGYKNRGTRANYVNRFRVRAALRSRNQLSGSSVLVFCGGCVAGTTAEAILMARYAVEQLGYAGPYVLDRDSVSTWENIRNAIPHLEDFDVIKIVSNSLHAELGRTYLQRLRPDLARRLVPAADYRFGEITVVKVVAAVLHLRKQRRRK
ncbi:YdcF family protein [Naasia lichenicola]|uniref:YdcF family protein n=1 Tax=Naasia lichenicola TaxID=2565933 RepID=A0A4S4FI36_9MICO|nr:YdcF family protein [Naasia lichenicola]